MEPPGCSKVSSVDSIDFDFPELPSIIQKEPNRTARSESPARQRHQRPSECSICGKTANGYHYDVPSCNGCKTFFRRLCVSEKSFICKAGGDCFNLTKRKVPLKCRACRYEKCISEGMNPNAMLLDEKEATAENFKKLKKRVNQSNPKDPDDDSGEDIEHQIEKKQVIKDVACIENKMQKLVDMLNYLERKPMPGWPLKTQSSPPKIPEFGKKPTGPAYSPDQKCWILYDLMVSIEYAKTFMFFHQLDSRDRLVLMRYVALALMNLHISYFTVAKKYDTIIHPDGKLAPMKKGMVYAETVMSIAPLIRCEIQETEFVLLKAICLCNPAVPDLSQHAQEILGREREQYADALFDHCLRNRKDGPSQFAELIGMVDLLERQQRMQKDLHLLHVAPFVSKIPQKDKMLLVDDIMNF
ncbi:Nuclear Hormone Receptor family [Caenorhabditis elegans]|uniref:Nuclear Hormone Receptor family n=1 Tax=Caenorhabditis elegans TaxID=6239 RepID=F5GUE4_CAEEL|nr:Nuclear Hormone Receptor family [Caenorhabditis elegans]CCA65541.1 Nuclear Hormone Receptor family [Caenorhabditis elegans]|eukprot:NP_001256500.1 Nuclear Hormone Receptor family [Caenorhabditis elegans]